MSFLYNIAVYLYLMLIRISALLNPKARLWLDGRKKWYQHLQKSIDKKHRYAWFHAASLGEFEQGRPVIEKFRREFPEYKVILTFFSPSGFEVRKGYEGADVVCYLPLDIPGNAVKFVTLVNPAIAVFIKYEFWFNYLKTLHSRNIPTLVVSAIFRKEQHFFKAYGNWFRKHLRNLDGIFVQNEASAMLLRSIGMDRVQISGDTRFDRVASIAEHPDKFPNIQKFSKEKKVLLAGSSWPADEAFLPALFEENIPNLRMIIAPHEIHEAHIRSIEVLFTKFKTVRFSKISEIGVAEADVLIIDGMGFLSGLYQYCDLAYIGGGFGKGIHNILEAVTFGKPVIFGPNYRKFNEAVELVDKGGAFTIDNQQDFLNKAKLLLTHEPTHSKAAFTCKSYIASKIGATEIIIKSTRAILKQNGY